MLGGILVNPGLSSVRFRPSFTLLVSTIIVPSSVQFRLRFHLFTAVERLIFDELYEVLTKKEGVKFSHSAHSPNDIIVVLPLIETPLIIARNFRRSSNICRNYYPLY